MKRIVSISLLILLAFVGVSSIAHQLEQQDEHCNEAGTHICAPDAHHHCSLCDSLVTLGFTTNTFLETQNILWNENYIMPTTQAIQCTQAADKLGRAPPCV